MFSFDFFLKKYPPSEDCIIRQKMKIIGDKWSLITLFVIEKHTIIRFSDLCREISDLGGIISQKVLSDTLKKLEIEGMIYREIYSEVPPRVEYSLTDSAKKLLPVLYQLLEWIDKNYNQKE